MFAKHYQSIMLGIMLLIYMLILYTTDFSNLTYWMLFFICFYYRENIGYGAGETL